MTQHVLLGITSSIAAYKTIELIQLLQSSNVTVSVIMTPAATEMIDLKEFERLGVKVYTHLFSDDFDYKQILQSKYVEHIQFADSTNLILIAPATANTIAKLAYGLADNLLTTVSLATTKPIVLAPAMNVNMWNNPIVQENVQKLKERGYTIIEPTKGMLACGYEGKGKLENVELIVTEVHSLLTKSKRLSGKKIIVTAGGTIEPIDDVRVITNKSSGKMGIALAEQLFLQGADVLLLRAKDSVKPRFLIPEQTFITTKDLLALIKKYVKEYDTIFHAAAVSDFLVEQRIGKLSSVTKQIIKLSPQIKIVEEIKKLHPDIQLFAFKAVYGQKTLLKKARAKRTESNADAVIANDISQKDRGFLSDNNEVWIVTEKQTKHFSVKPKKELAKEIIDFLL